MTGGGADVQDHALRHELNVELHMRRFPEVEPPFRLLQIMVLRDTGPLSATAESEKQMVAEVARGGDAAQLESGPGFLLCRDSETTVRWERHTEFSTFTFLRTGLEKPDFDAAEWEAVRKRWVLPRVGKILRGVQVVCLDRLTPPAAAIMSAFNEQSLVSSMALAGAARIWSDFRLHEDGYGRLLIRDEALVGHQCRQLVQSLLEIGNYRKACLLGLPVVHGLMHDLRTTEVELAALVRRMTENRIDNDTAFTQLTRLADRVESQISETTYRFEASRAYYRLAMERITALNERSVCGFETLQQFTERRLTPGFRTIDSVRKRLHYVSDRTARINDMIRTRISSGLEGQHVALLKALNRRIRFNTRLQTTFEKFSFIAISYYAIGILSEILETLEGKLAPFHGALLKLAAIPAAIVLTWFMMVRAKRSALAGGEQDKTKL